jgi:hypothetical protein
MAGWSEVFRLARQAKGGPWSFAHAHTRRARQCCRERTPTPPASPLRGAHTIPVAAPVSVPIHSIGTLDSAGRTSCLQSPTPVLGVQSVVPPVFRDSGQPETPPESRDRTSGL